MKKLTFTAFQLLIYTLIAGACAGNKTPATDYTVYTTDEDRAVYERFMSEMKPLKDLPQDELIIKTGRFFLETPYVGKTLEIEPEGLVVNLRELDCTTFVETVFTLVRTLKSGDLSFDNYCNLLKELRYRDGKKSIISYTNRLHYTSDCLYENERKGIWKDVTKEAGGIAYPLQLSFMSAHPDSYPQLKDSPEGIRFMQAKEEEINSRPYYYIPESDIGKLSAGMKSGDMVCFVTTIKGLDISHVGILYWENGALTFMHASSTVEQVIVNPEPLASYLERIKSNSGIMIARLK